MLLAVSKYQLMQKMLRIVFLVSETFVGAFIVYHDKCDLFMPTAIYAWCALLFVSVPLFWIQRWWGWIGFITCCLAFVMETMGFHGCRLK